MSDKISSIPGQSKKPQNADLPGKAPSSFFKPFIQAKLTINQPNDIYEQEADAVADKVMLMPEKSKPAFFQPNPLTVQRECTTCEEKEKLQLKEDENEFVQLKQEKEFDVQRKCDANGGEKKIQRQESSANTTPDVSPTVETTLQLAGQRLDEPTRTFMEKRIGADFSNVQVHNDSIAHQSSSEINALAYTHQNHIVFGKGAYQPQTDQGKKLLAHELTHVVQQTGVNGSNNIQKANAVSRVKENNPGYFNNKNQGAPVPETFTLNGQSLIFRVVVPRPAARLTQSQIFLGNPGGAPPLPPMNLNSFRSYTQEQADWFVEPTLTATDRDDLWRLLLLAQEGPHILSGIGDLLLSDLRAVVAGDWNPLKAFCRGTHSSGQTIRIFPPLPLLADRIALGTTLLGLEAVIPGPVLSITVSQSQLEQVRTQALLPVLTSYWTDFEPHIQQTFSPVPGGAGAEFARVINFLVSLGAPGIAPLLPLKGATPNLRWVRSLHRFPLPMLLKLVSNLGVTSGAKRLVLVLHTGHDAVAAFQDAANLFSNLVLHSPNNLVLMIEGATSLADITARIPNITSTWGQMVGGARRISQVIIAGHGSAQSVGMAGTGVPTTTGDEVTYPNEESLNIGGSPAELATTQALLNAILTHMPPATARILFAGCLIGSTHVAAGTPAAAIPGALAANQSLGPFTQGLAGAAGIAANRVQSARASVALGMVTSLFNPGTGNVGISSANYAFDPNAFGSATSYAQSGREPEGVLRSAVEVGAISLVNAENLLRTRLGMAVIPNDWYDSITRILVAQALPAVVGSGINLQSVNELANLAGVPFLAHWPRFNISVAHFTGNMNPNPSALAIYTGISGTVQYTAPTADETERMRIIVDQGWLSLTGAVKVPTFLAGILATGFPANAFQNFLDLGVLTPHAAALLPLAGVPSVEQIRLAVAWFSLAPANPHVRSFLINRVLHPPNAPAAFPPSFSTEITAAGLTDREILDELGFSATSQAAPVVGGPPQEFANLALPGTASNTILTSGHPYLATVIAAPNVIVRNGPSLAVTGIMTLGNGASVRVTGFTGTWAAVDVWGRLGFIQRSDLTPP